MAKSLLCGVAALSLFAAPARAQDAVPALAVSVRYVFDATTVAKGEDPRSFVLDDAEVQARFDLGQLAGLRGLSAGGHLLANIGGRPNDAADTLQGVDNIEVAAHRFKLYEAWIEQTLGTRASVRIGLTDLNVDFYNTDASGLLLAPSFGIGSELSATGPNGPSIFPSTALTARLHVDIGKHGYLRLAAADAKAGVLGDPNGVDFSFDDGALLIVEGGTTRGGKLALGLWRYTERQDDIRAASPVARTAQGAYVLIDQRIAGNETQGLHGFARIGGSDGDTTPFRGGYQLGVLVTAPIHGRPDGQLSLGFQQGELSDGFIANLRGAGLQPTRTEWGLELTYQDKLAPFLNVQPDLQYVRRAFSITGRTGTIVAGLRLVAAFGD